MTAVTGITDSHIISPSCEFSHLTQQKCFWICDEMVTLHCEAEKQKLHLYFLSLTLATNLHSKVQSLKDPFSSLTPKTYGKYIFD